MLARVLVALVALLAVLGLPNSRAAADAPGAVVYRLRIEGPIDMGLVPYVKRTLTEAKAAQAEAVIVEIDTLGGRVDAAIAIRDELLRAPVRTIAWVDKRAISAGALIALATTTIAMADGATIGAATPVSVDESGASHAVGEKTVSYVRKEFAATAESRGRPRALAEAMVDADVVVPDVIEAGKLLTLTTSEAVQHGIAQLRADDRAALLRATGLEGAEIRERTPTWAEHVVRFLTTPLVGSLLMSLGLLGLFVEIKTPGFGIPGLIGLVALALFFWGHSLVHLVGWEQVALIAIGLILIALEVFVIPGFGIAGVLGGLALAAGLTMSLAGSGATIVAVVRALGHVALSILLAIAGALVLLRFLPRTRAGRKLVLETAIGPDSAPFASFVGKHGIARSPLRPSGIAEIDGTRVDVVTEGGFVALGEPIEVVAAEGHRIVVRARSTGASAG